MENKDVKHDSKKDDKQPAPMSRGERLKGILKDHGKTMRKARALTEKVLYNDKGA